METGKIRDVVLGFENVLDSIPRQYDNFEDALDKIFEAFYLTMNEMLPMKHFVLYEDKYDYEIAILDSSDECDNWIELICDSGLGDGESCRKITFSEFVELSCDEWGSPNCYHSELDDVLVFRL